MGPGSAGIPILWHAHISHIATAHRGADRDKEMDLLFIDNSIQMSLVMSQMSLVISQMHRKMIENGHASPKDGLIIHGGCRKFLLLFGRIGPLALRPCALLRAWGLLPHSINILQIPRWYGDMVCLARALAPSCAALHFWCLYIMLSKSYLPRRCDWKDGSFNESPHAFTIWRGSTVIGNSSSLIQESGANFDSTPRSPEHITSASAQLR